MPRQMYGLGSLVKDRIRKLIPNELASVAVKAAPFVAPFNPAVAGLMRGIGRFDQRGSISDALKQGAGTFAFGAGVRGLGGADPFGGGLRGGFTSPLSPERTQQFTSLFDKQQATDAGSKLSEQMSEVSIPTEKKGVISVARDLARAGIKKLPDGIAAQLAAGGITAGASLLASYFQGDFREQEPGETMEEYLAERKKYVGTQMRTYMDNYFANDPEYMKLDDAGRDAFVARYNIRDGGRVGYQAGGLSMLSTLAQNIARNKAAQAAFQKSIEPARKRIKQTIQSGVDRAQNIIMNQAPNRFIDYLSGRTEPVTNLSEIASTQSTRDAINKGILSSLKRNQVTNPMGAQNSLVKSTDYGGYKLGEAQKSIDASSLGDFLKKAAPSMGGEIVQFADTMLGSPQDQIANTLGDFTFQYKPPSYDFDDDYMGIKDKVDFPTTGFLPGSAYDVNVELTDPDTKQKIREQLFKDAPTPTPDAGTVSQEGLLEGVTRFKNPKPRFSGDEFLYSVPGVEGKLTQSTYDAYVNENTKTTPTPDATTQGTIPGFSVITEGDKTLYVGPDGQIYGPETYASIAAGMYPNIYDPRANVASGGMPTGIMRSNKAGVMERDYRETGGFVPVGVKEKADDVPAMLSKNEFVFTADAVRGAGNGSIERGAQKMYDTMKRLEKRVV